jgi:fructose-1-phosphate kinase PfkB-like protein
MKALHWLYSAMATMDTSSPSTSSTRTNNNAIVILGLNAALQKRMVLGDDKTLIPGNVHRATAVQTGVGGKGQDVAIAMNCLNMKNLQLAQFLGQGAAGDAVHQMLKDTLAGPSQSSSSSSLSLTVRVQSELRTCTSIVTSSETTEIIEPSGTIQAEEWKELIHTLKTQHQTPVDAVCCMGSLPPGCPADSYAECYAPIAGPQTLCVIDSVAGLQPLLAKMVGPTIVKLNASELCKLVGCASTSSETAGVAPDDLTHSIQQFMEQFAPSDALQALAITDGKHPTHVCVWNHSNNQEYQLYQLPIPVLLDDSSPSRTLYPIGAGDAVAAGTLSAWLALTKQPQPPTEDGSSVLPTACQTVLGDYPSRLLSLEEESSPDDHTCRLLTAVAFGVACGSASKFANVDDLQKLDQLGHTGTRTLSLTHAHLLPPSFLLIGCLQEENSVLKVSDVVRLFASTAPPTLVWNKKSLL